MNIHEKYTNNGRGIRALGPSEEAILQSIGCYHFLSAEQVNRLHFSQGSLRYSQTKLKHFAACKTAIDAPTTARLFLDSVVRLHGMPERIISDRDPRFTAHFWKAFWAGLGTTLSMSTAYHPQTDGQTEKLEK